MNSCIIQMDADYDPSQVVEKSNKKKKKSKFKQALAKTKPVFDPGKVLHIKKCL